MSRPSASKRSPVARDHGDTGLATKDLVVDLARALRRQVLPNLGAHAGRARTRPGVGGDVTFAIDQQAEDFLELFLREHAPELAFYSEDRGLVRPAGDGVDHERILIVDPIDGTRPALAGLESACVSVAAAALAGEEPTMKDVLIGCIVEVKTGATFLAQRGMGIQIWDGVGTPARPRLSDNTRLARLFWSSGFRGRPANLLVEVLGELIDSSSVGGAFFDLGSATFDLTRIVTGQLDAYLDVGSLIIEELPKARGRFEQIGEGAVLNNSPYDLAAAVLCLQEAGAVVTDARGDPLDRRPLLGAGHEFQMSCLAAASPPLHSELLGAVERGIEQLLARWS